ARSFVEISRVRLEGLLASFPKLVESEKQHTFVETDSVRYVYHPLDSSLYLLVLTNKQSNILEDLETLQLLTKLVPEYSRSLDEDEIVRSAFDLLFAFDEAISQGHREKVTVPQIKTFTTMDSQEEKFFDMMERTKRQEVLEHAKRREYEIEQQKAEQGFYQLPPQGSGNSYGGYSKPPPSSYSQPSPAPVSSYQLSSFAEAPRAAPKGMVLQKSPGDAFERQLQKDGISLEPRGGPSAPPSSSPSSAPSASQGSAEPLVPRKAVHITLNETFNASVSREGGINSLTINGDFSLLISDLNSGHIAIKLANFEQAKSRGFTFEAHPNLNRGAFDQGIIVHRDSTRPLAVGNAFRVFRWRLGKSETDESMLPLRLTCWPSPIGDGRSTVALDFELVISSLELQNLVIEIPIPHSPHAPVVEEIEGGSTAFDQRSSTLRWSIPVVDSGSSSTGRLEFSMSSTATDALFPIRLRFDSTTPICPIHPQAVATTKDAHQIDFSTEKILKIDNYVIE
ncbi:MAG: coatomer subunit delta, partial [archaeon]|nr:coatomer subunit delta [archaeon]